MELNPPHHRITADTRSVDFEVHEKLGGSESATCRFAPSFEPPDGWTLERVVGARWRLTWPDEISASETAVPILVASMRTSSIISIRLVRHADAHPRDPSVDRTAKLTAQLMASGYDAERAATQAMSTVDRERKEAVAKSREGMLAQAIAAKIAAGMAPQEAAKAALEEIGT